MQLHRKKGCVSLRLTSALCAPPNLTTEWTRKLSMHALCARAAAHAHQLHRPCLGGDALCHPAVLLPRHHEVRSPQPATGQISRPMCTIRSLPAPRSIFHCYSPVQLAQLLEYIRKQYCTSVEVSPNQPVWAPCSPFQSRGTFLWPAVCTGSVQTQRASCRPPAWATSSASCGCSCCCLPMPPSSSQGSLSWTCLSSSGALSTAPASAARPALPQKCPLPAIPTAKLSLSGSRATHVPGVFGLSPRLQEVGHVLQ